MIELKKKINYTVVCVNEFASKFNIASKEAFDYLYEHKGIEFSKSIMILNIRLAWMMLLRILR